MPAFFINPIDEEHIELLNRLDVQNQDLRVFVSDKNSQDFIDRIPGKKAIGDITDDSHISTASEGAYCGIFFEGNSIQLRDIFLNAIKNSNLQRILWISQSNAGRGFKHTHMVPREHVGESLLNFTYRLAEAAI